MTQNGTGTSATKRGPQSKVARLIEEYELEGIGGDLEDYWVGEDDRLSLRELADWFNRQVLRAVVEDADIDALEGEIENLYRLLAEEDVSAGMRIQARNKLERGGIDIDDLEEDFVSYQAIRTYLIKHRNVESSDGSKAADQVEKEADNISRLESRIVAVVRQKLETLRDTGRLDIGAFHLLVNVRVVCEACGESYEVAELLRQRSCGCSS